MQTHISKSFTYYLMLNLLHIVLMLRSSQSYVLAYWSLGRTSHAKKISDILLDNMDKINFSVILKTNDNNVLKLLWSKKAYESYQVCCSKKKLIRNCSGFFLNIVCFMQKGKYPMSNFPGVIQNIATSKTYKEQSSWPSFLLNAATSFLLTTI